jgi:hypothetical protein
LPLRSGCQDVWVTTGSRHGFEAVRRITTTGAHVAFWWQSPHSGNKLARVGWR